MQSSWHLNYRLSKFRLNIRPRTNRLALTAMFFTSLFFLNACAQDTPLTPESSIPATPAIPGIETPTARAGRATPDVQTLVPLPATPKGLPTLASAGATPTPTAIPRDAQLTLPDCTPPIEVPVELPPNLPRDFPYPPGMKLFDSATLRNNPNNVRIIGYAPLTLVEGVRYVLTRYPEAGYMIGHGDSEFGEAEAQFSGKGWIGAFRIRSLRDCPSVTQWLLVFLKQETQTSAP